jgi:hypothetical protein
MTVEESSFSNSIADRDAGRFEPRTRWQSPYLWLGILLLLSLATPFLPVPSLAAAVAGTILITVLYVVAVVQFAAHATRQQWPIGAQIGLLVVTLLLWAIMQYVTKPLLESMMRAAAEAREDGPPLLRWLGLLNFTLRSLMLVCVGVFGGALVARLIKTPNMIGPVCAIIIMIDIWGVLFGGIVHQLMTNKATQHIASSAMASLPRMASAAARPQQWAIDPPAVGVGDFLFLGLLFAALHNLGMNWRGAVLWITPLIILALLAVTFSVPALPGLLFIGVGVAIPNWKYFQYTRDEKFALLWAGLFVLLLTAVLYFVIVSQLPSK